MDGKIFNSRGVHVAIVLGPAIFDLKGQKIYDLRGVNIYKLSGELVGHLTDAQEGTGQVDKANNVTSLVATVVLAWARRGMMNKIRLANAAIVAVEKQRKHQPSMACIT